MTQYGCHLVNSWHVCLSLSSMIDSLRIHGHLAWCSLMQVIQIIIRHWYRSATL